jgi:hypothetical protein
MFLGSALHAIGPVEEAAQFLTVGPNETPEHTKTNTVGVETRVRLDTPAQIRAAPRRQAVAAGRLP